MLAPIAFDENARNDKKEDGAKSTCESDKYDEADGHMTTYFQISQEVTMCSKLDRALTCCLELDCFL